MLHKRQPNVAEIRVRCKVLINLAWVSYESSAIVIFEGQNAWVFDVATTSRYGAQAEMSPCEVTCVHVSVLSRLQD